jgi:choline kinase
MRVVDIVAAEWIDVDTPAALAEAERLARAGAVGCLVRP